MIGVGANAQTRGEFTEIEGGFKIARATEKDGSHAVLVLFPENYLNSGEAYAEGTIKALPIILGCDYFKECKPVPYGVGKDANGRLFILFENETDPNTFVVVFKLGDDNGKPIGIVIQLILR
jgi:hypothetical protein